MGTTISESARIGSGSTGAASGIRLRRVVQPVFNDNACGKHRLMVIPRLSYNFLDPLLCRVQVGQRSSARPGEHEIGTRTCVFVRAQRVCMFGTVSCVSESDAYVSGVYARVV